MYVYDVDELYDNNMHISGAHISGAHTSGAHTSDAHISDAHISDAHISVYTIMQLPFTHSLHYKIKPYISRPDKKTFV